MQPLRRRGRGLGHQHKHIWLTAAPCGASASKPPTVNLLKWPRGNAHAALPHQKKKSPERFRQVLDFITVSGRRDWTRTNDPHHVKVVL